MQRELYLRRARQAEAASHINEWLTSPGLQRYHAGAFRGSASFQKPIDTLEVVEYVGLLFVVSPGVG